MSIVTDWSRESIPGPMTSSAETHSNIVTNVSRPANGNGIHHKSRTPSISRPLSSLGRPVSSLGHARSLSSPGHAVASSLLNHSQIHLPETAVHIPSHTQSLPVAPSQSPIYPAASLHSLQDLSISPSNASAANQTPSSLAPLQTQSEPTWVPDIDPLPAPVHSAPAVTTQKDPAHMHSESEAHQQQPLASETAPAPPLSEILRLRSQLQSQSSTPLEANATEADYIAPIEEVPISSSASPIEVDEESQIPLKRSNNGDSPGDDHEPTLKKARLDDASIVPVVNNAEIDVMIVSPSTDLNPSEGGEVKGEDEDEDDEEEEDEIGPDGLRIADFCVAAIMVDDEDDENKKSCRLCV